VNKKRVASAISGGIFVISLGVLLITGWWWPGIMIAIGLSSGAELIFRGKTLQGIGSLAFFCAIPIVVAVVQRIDIPWPVVGGLILIGGGVITLVRVFFLGND
jgi:hypothetical protein